MCLTFYRQTGGGPSTERHSCYYMHSPCLSGFVVPYFPHVYYSILPPESAASQDALCFSDVTFSTRSRCSFNWKNIGRYFSKLALVFTQPDIMSFANGKNIVTFVLLLFSVAT